MSGHLPATGNHKVPGSMPSWGLSAAVVSLGKKLAPIAWATQLLNQDNIGVCTQGGAEEQRSGYNMLKKSF